MRLSRQRLGRPPAPVRIVHIGPGAFHRAHQAWYTGLVDPDWGIAAVTARSDAMVESLGGQDGLYTVVTPGPGGDGAVVVGSISEVVGHADPRAVSLLALPAVSVVTLTLTEAGYGSDSAALGRLVAGLRARRQAGGGPIAVLSCDNLVGNGRVVSDRIGALAAEAPDDLAGWIATSCVFPDTVVDRITPAATEEDLRIAARLTGWEDRAAVVTEPLTEWVIADTAGGIALPAWERAGARFVADVGPWERRKLRLLNAGHSLFAYLGPRRGHRWVHEAAADPGLHGAVVALWAEARAALPVDDATDLDSYCAAVLERWANARLPHALSQIALSGRRKLQVRIVPTMVASRETGGAPVSCALTVAAWAAQVRAGALVDPDVDPSVLSGTPTAVVARRALALLDDRNDDGLAGDAWSVGAVAESLAALES